MSVEQLTAQAIPTEVPLIFDVLNRVRAAGNIADPSDAKAGAMAAIDMAGSVVFDGVLETMAGIRTESIAAGHDYNLHTRYGEYLQQRQELTRLRTLASNIESAKNVHEGLIDFYAGRTPEVEKQGVGRKIINTAFSAYAAVKKGAAEKLHQARESIKTMTPRARAIGAVAMVGVILAGSLSIPGSNKSDAPKARFIAAQTEVVAELPAQPALPSVTETPPAQEFKEVTVQPGDSLWLIAQRNNSNVDAIFNNNSNIIKDPALVYGGQVLKIPVGKIALSDIIQTQTKINSAPVVLPQTESVAVADVSTKSTVVPAVEKENKPAVAERQSSHVDVSFDNIPSINGVDKELIKDVVAYLIHEQGCTPRGAAYLAGNFITESGLDPQSPGGGLAQWAGSRLTGMPHDLYGQIDFALNVEMNRDGMASDLDELLRDPEATHAQIQGALRRWERWGIQGNRFEFAQTILAAIQG